MLFNIVQLLYSTVYDYGCDDLFMAILVWFYVFNATSKSQYFNYLLLVLLMEETGVSKETHRPVRGATRWQILSHKVVSNTPRHVMIDNIFLFLF